MDYDKHIPVIFIIAVLSLVGICVFAALFLGAAMAEPTASQTVICQEDRTLTPPDCYVYIGNGENYYVSWFYNDNQKDSITPICDRVMSWCNDPISVIKGWMNCTWIPKERTCECNEIEKLSTI